MPSWLVTGAGGQLGSDLLRVAADRDVVGVTRAELDIADPDAVEKVFADVRPTVVFNAAAWTAVDKAEAEEEAAYRVNAVGPQTLATAAARHGAALITVSTDYVFAGDADEPYSPAAPTGPRSAYGRTKLAGERAVRAALPEASWVVRTAWVYGESGGGNFVKTMARLEASRDTITVVDDQRGSPTWSQDLARGLVALADSTAPPGIYHCTNTGETTWCGLARAVFAELGADPERVRPISTDQYPTPARRPAYSVLSGVEWQAAGLPVLPDWRDALHAAMAASGAYRVT